MAIYVADKPTLDAVLSIAQRLDANIMNAQTMDWELISPPEQPESCFQRNFITSP